MADQISQLERDGYYQETYQQRNQKFKEWNHGVWNHQWKLLKNQPCDLCESQDVSITAGQKTLCLACLDEFPLVPWHPTGAVRPKLRVLLQHLTNCGSPSTHETPPAGDSS